MPLFLWCVLAAEITPSAAQQVAPGPAVATGRAIADPPPELEGIEQFIQRGMQDWQIPGLAISIVKDDELVWARGFGVRRLEHQDPVDENTLFNVASVSKAFTSAAIAVLVDEGRLDWDDPVVKHLPQFQLYDPYVTREVTIRDLLAHRVGVGRMTGNRLRWIPARDRSEMIYRMRYLGPEQSFRNGHVYSNVMYMVAGEIIPAVTGTSWEDFVRQRLFQPLEMHTSKSSVTQLSDDDNVAFPHQDVDGEVVEIPRRNFDAVGPAASVHSTATEIAAWMRLHLGEPGAYGGERIISRRAILETHRSQVVLRETAFEPLTAYGLGWGLSNYEGLRISRHSGAVDGMNTTLVLVPELQLGIFVTTNVFNDFMNALANHVLDVYLEIPDRDWHQQTWSDYQQQRRRVQARRDEIHAARQTGTQPSVPFENFVGRYDDPLYADAEVSMDGDQLVLQLWGDDDQIADLEHWHHDTFRAIWRNRSQREEFVWFTRGPDGEIDRLHIEWNLRPALLQVGAYPSSYTRVATFQRSVGD